MARPTIRKRLGDMTYLLLTPSILLYLESDYKDKTESVPVLNEVENQFFSASSSVTDDDPHRCTPLKWIDQRQLHVTTGYLSRLLCSSMKYASLWSLDLIIVLLPYLAFLVANFTPADKPLLPFAYIREAAGTATDIPMLASRIAEDEGMWRNIACHH